MGARLPDVLRLLTNARLHTPRSPTGQSLCSAPTADGVRPLLAWARPGDLLVLPVHALDARERAIQLVQNWT